MILKLKHPDEWEYTGTSCNSRPTVNQQHNVQAFDIVAAQRREVCLGNRWGVRDYFLVREVKPLSRKYFSKV
jgi:hypothetical protein